MIVPATEENIDLAAAAIRAGRLVGMPTETVYGLAANAFNPEAVSTTFAAKGRPADNPLIVHLASVNDVEQVAWSFPILAQRLAERFWPGPLTLVLPKRPIVPDVTSGGLHTVAVRVPAHPVARALISASGVPLSAPSANRFMGLSPTRAEDIEPLLIGVLACVLDGGPCAVGLESTVVDVSEDVPRLLRPGGISQAELEAFLGVTVPRGGVGERRSPGQYPRHYAPTTPLLLVDKVGSDDAGIVFGAPASSRQIRLGDDAVSYAAGLYRALHGLDREGVDAIYVERPPRQPEWDAVWDRLNRASVRN